MAIDQIKQSIDSQIDGIISSSPVTTPPVAEAPDVKTPVNVPASNQSVTPASGDYGAVRMNSFTPSTQLSSGVSLSNNPDDVYTGGIVEAGRDAYADLPESSDDFYLRVKYAPVKQYPLRMPDGHLYDVTTSDFRKAMWQFYIDKMGVPADADWFGYYYVPEQVRETFVGSMLRAIPNTATELGSDLVSAVMRLPANAFEAMGIAPETSAAYDEIIKDVFNNVKDTLHVGDVTEETANKYGSMTGGALFTVGAAILSGGSSLAVNTLAAAEAASAYNGIYDSLKNAGYSPASAFAMSVGGGLGVGLLSRAGNVGERAMRASAGAGRGLVYAALKNPGELSRMAKMSVPYHALAEAITEPLQSELENFMSSGMSLDSLGENFDERLFEFFSALAIGAGAAYYNSTKMPAYEDQIRSYANEMRTTLERIQKALPYSSKGIITDEVLADLIAVVNKPEFGRVAYEMMRESIYGQFDKVPKSEREKLAKTLSKLDSAAALEKEYSIFEERLDKLFANSGLDYNVESELRSLLRAVASWNLAKRGILPSAAPLPQKISIEPTRTVKDLDGGVAAGVAGHTLGDVIFLNPAVPSSPMVSQNVGQDSAAEPKNMKKSRSVMSEAARTAKGNQNVDQSRGARVAYARHEVTHWIMENSGLQDVPRFMAALRRIANSVVPNFTKGKKGVELAEAYAVGMQYASEQAAREIGLQGPVGEYIDFMHTMLYAQERAQGLQKDVQTYVETLRAVMSQNKAFVDELIKGFGSEKLRGAIKEFVKTGDTSLLDAETIRGLNSVLQSVADALTQDNLESVFGSPNQMRGFSKQVANLRSEKAKADRAAEKAVREEVRKEADAIVGIAEEEAPVVDTVEDAVVEGVADEIPVFNETQEVAKQEEVEPQENTKAKAASEDEPKAAIDQDVKEWVNSPHTVPAAENRTGATKNIEEMSEQKLLEWRVHIPEIIRTEITSPVADDLELTWEDSSDQTPFRFKSEVRSNPEKRKQLQARLKQYYNTIVGEVNRRIEEGEMSDSGKHFIESNGLFAVWNPNMLWSDDYVTHLANKIAGRLEGQVATEAEKQLYRAIREYEKNVAFLYDGYVTDYLAVPRAEPYQRSFSGMGYKEHMSGDVHLSTGKTIRTVSDQLAKLEQEKSSLLKEQARLQKDEKALLNELSGFDRYLDGVLSGRPYDSLPEKDKAEYNRITGERAAVLSDRNSTKARLAKIKREIPKLDAKLNEERARLEPESVSESVLSSTGNLIGMDDASAISENTAERVYSAIDYLQDLEEALSAISISDDPKLLGFLYGLNEQNARRISYKEIGEQYAKATKRLSMGELADKDYYKSRNMWLQDGLIKRVRNRIDWLQGKIPGLLTESEQLKAMSDSYKKELTGKIAPIDLNAIEDKIDQLTKMLEEAPKQAAELEKTIESLESDYLSELEKTEDPSKYNKTLDRAAERLYNAKQKLASVKSYGDIIPKQIQQLQDSMVGGGAKPLSKDLLKLFAHDNDDVIFAEFNTRNRELAAVSGDPYYYLSDKAYKVNVDKNGRPTDVIGAIEASRKKRALATRKELVSLKKAYLEAKAEHKKALDALNAKRTNANKDKASKAEEAAKAARNKVIRAAQRHAEVLEHVPVPSNGVYYPSIARFFSPKRLGGDFIRQNARDEEGNDLLLKTDESKWAQFINPAKPERAVGQVHPVTTPTPLEQIELETGFTFADAQKVVTYAGLKIPKLDLSVVTPEKVARYYDDGVATFSRVYARLLDQVASWGGAESLDYATRMRVLVGIDMAKQAARDIVGEYQISKEIGFLQNPTRGSGITASAVELDQSERGASIKAENAKLGYSIAANPYELKAGDQVAFAKGNKIVKAVVSYVMPVGPNKAVFLRHLVDVSNVDLSNMTDKQISALDKKMIEDVISASDLSKVAVMQKVAVKGDAEKIGKMFDAYDKVMGAMQRDNWTLEALASVPPETLQGQIAADILENMRTEYDPYENSSDDDFEGGGMYAVMPDIVPSTPVIDPGKFVVRGLSDANPNTTNPMTLSDEEFRELLGDPEEFEARLKAEAQLTQDQARSAVMDVALNAAKDYLRDMDKPSFSSVMNSTEYSGRNRMYGMTPLKQFELVNKGLDETKTSKLLYPFGATTGLDRKLALNIGQKNAQDAFGFIEAASIAQQEKESWMQAMIESAVKDVFGGKRTAYDRWRIDIKNDKIEATVEGVKQKVSEAEIMSLYAMSKKPAMPGEKSQFERAAVPFGGVEAAQKLIEQLSPESKSFVDLIGSGTMAGISQHPEWVPAVEFVRYRGSGWASRKKNKVDYVPGFEVVNSDTPLAALDYYDSITKAITKYAMDASGLRAQLENLQMIFEFDKRVDRSKFAPIAPGSVDEQLFNDMSARSKLMRDKLAEKIGARMANSFMKNIEYDLNNPSFLDDVAATPEAKWFGRFSRSSGASVLMLNIKQGLQNLGNYHRLFGLSGNNMFKYYTTDWVKAVMHTREAWALMKQNPELLRRLKQAGLSEHMMRVVDENADSIFTDIQAKFLEHGRNKASNVTAFLGTVSNMATKWGMAPNVFGDALGLAWGNYAVYENVRSQVDAANRAELLKKRDARDVDAIIDEMTHREIGNFVNSHISSSNYMARSMLTKMMNKMGLGALVMFTNDQLQGFGSLAQAISVLQNSKDKVELERARKDIMAWAVSTVRYIAIKAGWYGALAAMAMGRDLDDEEMDYIYSSTVSEAVMQMGGWHQLSNLGIAPVLRAIIDGDRLGPSIVSVSAAGRGISAARRGDWWDFASEAASMTVFPVANGLSRVVEAVNYIMSSNEYEQQVGWKMALGSSKGGAMESLGLTDKNKAKEVKPKKKLKKDGE